MFRLSIRFAAAFDIALYDETADADDDKHRPEGAGDPVLPEERSPCAHGDDLLLGSRLVGDVVMCIGYTTRRTDVLFTLTLIFSRGR